MPARLRFIVLILAFLFASCPKLALAQTPAGRPVPDALSGARLSLTVEDAPRWRTRTVYFTLHDASGMERGGQGFEPHPPASPAGEAKPNSPPRRPPQP